MTRSGPRWPDRSILPHFISGDNMDKVTYRSIHPIGDSNPLDMPVANIDRAAAWYEKNMGFTVASRDEAARTVRIRRDTVEIQLAENGRDPEQASCYVEVSDPDAARAELAVSGVNISDLRLDDYGGHQYRVFFAKDDDGLCYCLGMRLD
jgi:hypothetical protein